MSVVDLHCHLLPGIDDGPPDLEASLAMARAAVSAGISTVVATPHLRADFPDVHAKEISDRCAALRQAMTDDGITLELVPGAEVALSWAFEATAADLREASLGARGTEILIETPALADNSLVALVDAISERGFQVVLAHPERSAFFHKDITPLRQLVSHGVLLQINADSILAGRESRVGHTAFRLLDADLAHIVASDGHRGTDWRPITALASAVDMLRGLVGAERAAYMSESAPRALAAGERPPVAPFAARPDARRRRFLPRGRTK